MAASMEKPGLLHHLSFSTRDLHVWLKLELLNGNNWVLIIFFCSHD
jgi:hypothetical protein